MSLTLCNTIKFQAKRNVYFCGVGITENYKSQDFVLKMKYRIVENDDQDIEPITIEASSPVNEERMHWFDIYNHNQNALFCQEGHYIEIGIRLT